MPSEPMRHLFTFLAVALALSSFDGAARTIADLKGEAKLLPEDIGEAIQYRELDQKYWR